jgi:hypothetical protein
MILLLELPEKQSYRDLAALSGSDYGSRIKEKVRRVCRENGRFSNKSWVTVGSGLGERKAKGRYLKGVTWGQVTNRQCLTLEHTATASSFDN